MELNRKQVIGIALAVTLVAAAVGLGIFFFGPPLGIPGVTDGDEPAGDEPEEFLAVLTVVSIEGLTVSVSAEGSIAPRGEYEWNFGERLGGCGTFYVCGATETVATTATTHTYAAPGVYIITLTVREVDTGEFLVHFDREYLMVEVGGAVGPSIPIEQSNDGVWWKLLFTEVPDVPNFRQQQIFGLKLHDASGVELLRTPIGGLFPSQGGDEQYHRASSVTISVGDSITLSTSVYPAGTTYKLYHLDLNWVLAEGTLV